MYSSGKAWLIIISVAVLILSICLIGFFSNKTRYNHNSGSFEAQLAKADNEYLYTKAKEYYEKGQLDSVIIHLTVIAKRGNDKSSAEQKEMSAEAFNDCGMIYFMMRNYPKSYNCFNQSIALGSERTGILARNNLASLYYCFNDKEQACRLLEEAAAGALKVGENDVLLSASLNLTIPYYENNNRKGLEESLKRLNNSDIPEDDSMKHYVETVIRGYLALLNEKPDSAVRIFRSLDTDHLKNNDKATVDNFGNIYRAYFKKGDLDSALMMADRMMHTPPGSPLSSEREMTASQMKAECVMPPWGRMQKKQRRRGDIMNSRIPFFQSSSTGKY